MTLTDLYPWLKALHVASALIFVGGVLVVTVFLPAISGTDAAKASTAQAIRRWDQAVTSPALMLVWAFGLALAIGENWFSSTWLQVKLVFVVALSAVHGIQSGRLRRLASEHDIKAPRTRVLIIGSIVVIAVLAVVKPG